MDDADQSPRWSVEPRSLAGVVGLAPEAEWQLGPRARKGEALPFFLPRTLTAFYEFRTYAVPERPPRPRAKRPPFSMVISPEPGGGNGQDILDVLQQIAKPPKGNDKEDLKELGTDPPLFVISQDDANRLAENGIAGALCNTSYFAKALADDRFTKIAKVIRLSSALRELAVPAVPPPIWAPPDWLAPTLQGAFENSPAPDDPPVVVGVIDDSFAIGHPRFQFSDGTSRILSFWDQDADFDSNVSTVPFGRELLSVNPSTVNQIGPADRA